MDWMPRFVRHVSYPLWTLLDGKLNFYRSLARFYHLDHSTRETLAATQIRALKQILSHANTNCPYYSRLFTAIKFDPSKLRSLDDIRVLPRLTKEQIRSNSSQILARNFSSYQVLPAATGGSTGMPMQFFRDAKCLELRAAQQAFFDRWAGYQLGDKLALFVAASHYPKPGDRFKAFIRNITLERTLRFDPHDITDSYLARFHAQLMSFSPNHIRCFPNSLLVYARFLLKTNTPAPSVRSITCTGETLYSEQKKLFQSLFSAPVYERYATKECGVIAQECRSHGRLHVFTPGVVLEILDSENQPVPPGQPGTVILTDLFNEAFPLIRYEIGDMAVPADTEVCACGSPLPIIERVLGRDRDILVDARGNPKPGYLFTNVLLNINPFAQFQIVQDDQFHLTVNVRDAHGEFTDLSSVESAFKNILGREVTVDFVRVSSIPRDPSGKYGYVISKIKNDFTRLRSLQQSNSDIEVA